MAPFYPNVIPAKHENSYVAGICRSIFSRTDGMAIEWVGGWPGRKYDEQTRMCVCVMTMFFPRLGIVILDSIHIYIRNRFYLNDRFLVYVELFLVVFHYCYLDHGAYKIYIFWYMLLLK